MYFLKPTQTFFGIIWYDSPYRFEMNPILIRLNYNKYDDAKELRLGAKILYFLDNSIANKQRKLNLESLHQE
jgi:hypothetical protein